MNLRRCAALLSILTLAGFARAADTVSIAAASDLVFCLESLNAEFAKANPGVALTVSTGSSGNFFAQIKNGAPFDVFLSADLRYPRELIAAKAADEKDLTLYAIGRIVLWTTRPDLEVGDLAAAVRSPLVKKLAIANPAHAPYGRAAEATLKTWRIYDLMAPRLVFGDNVSQAAQFVDTGAAQAGLVALALVKARSADLRFAEVPESAHPPLDQAGVILKRTALLEPARAFQKYLTGDAGRAILATYGFGLPRH